MERAESNEKRNRDYYITPEEYERAAANGISVRTLNKRVRRLGWSKEVAVTKPLPQRIVIPEELAALAKANKIPTRRIRHRVLEYGWSIEAACTTPLCNRSASLQKAHAARRRYPEKLVEIASRNGISYDTLTTRIRAGWAAERAATESIRKSRKG